MKENETLRRTFVHVYFKNNEGVTDEVRTYINLLPSEAAAYYLGKSFPFVGYGENGRYYEQKLTAWRVRCYRVEEYRDPGVWWCMTEDARESYRMQGGQIVKTAV